MTNEHEISLLQTCKPKKRRNGWKEQGSTTKRRRRPTAQCNRRWAFDRPGNNWWVAQAGNDNYTECNQTIPRVNSTNIPFPLGLLQFQTRKRFFLLFASISSSTLRTRIEQKCVEFDGRLPREFVPSRQAGLSPFFPSSRAKPSDIFKRALPPAFSEFLSSTTLIPSPTNLTPIPPTSLYQQ